MIGKVFEQWWEHWISRTQQSQSLPIEAPGRKRRAIDPIVPERLSADPVSPKHSAPAKGALPPEQ
jgi:hypothetical protein